MMGGVTKAWDEEDLQREEEEFRRLYGPWQPMQPGEVAELLSGCGFRWWVAGGLALEAVGADRRAHGDTDLAVLRRELPLVRGWLSGFHLWEAHSGALRPLRPGEAMTAAREQLWMRKDAYGPWLLDLVFSPSKGTDWIYKRHHGIRLPIESIGHVIGGIPYLRPEIVLLFKDKHHLAEDEADFGSTLPLLDASARAFLLEALRLSAPRSPWIERLQSFD
jgi:hypothetical protein